MNADLPATANIVIDVLYAVIDPRGGCRFPHLCDGGGEPRAAASSTVVAGASSTTSGTTPGSSTT